MHVPSEEELAAIATAYLVLQREHSMPPPPPSRWRIAARALEPDETQRARWRNASRVR
jgi:hypothetical protein